MKLSIFVTGFALSTLLGACGSTGINTSMATQPIPRDYARLVITRSTDLLYFGAGANVRVNGHLEGSLARGGTLIQNVPEGRTVLTVDATSGPGTYAVTFNAKEGKIYNLEVSPRSEGFAQSALWGIGGDMVHANVTDNTGYFQVMLKSIK